MGRSASGAGSGSGFGSGVNKGGITDVMSLALSGASSSVSTGISLPGKVNQLRCTNTIDASVRLLTCNFSKILRR